MKIAYITGFFDEKFYYREHAYAEYFCSKKNEYLILTSFLNLPQKKEGRPVDSGKYKVLRFPFLIRFKDFVILNYFRELDKYSPDLIHVFDAQQGVGLLAIMWAQKRNIPIVYDHELQRIPSSFFGRIRFYLISYPLIKYFLKKADLIRVVTPASIALINRIHNCPQNKISLGYLGYSDNFEQNAQLPFLFDDQFEYIMTSGFFDRSKNIESIVSGFLLHWRNNRNSRLLIIGTIENEKVVKLIESNDSIFHYKKFLSVEQLNYLYSKVRIHIWPKSTSSIFEALKFNDFVILKHGDDTSHLVSDQIVFISDFNMFNVSKKICDLIYKPLKSDNLKFSYNMILSRLKSSYEQLIFRKGE